MRKLRIQLARSMVCALAACVLASVASAQTVQRPASAEQPRVIVPRAQPQAPVQVQFPVGKPEVRSDAATVVTPVPQVVWRVLSMFQPGIELSDRVRLSEAGLYDR